MSLLLLALLGADRPNILLAISDDQSYPHASAYGTPGLHTPAFDRIAKAGILFTNAYAASPGCAPSRAALLTGRHCWTLEEAGTHASRFPAELVTYPERLANTGYHVGHTGKGWGPGNYRIEGRRHNPAGPAFDGPKLDPPSDGISSRDYAGNFAKFLEAKPSGQPFCFWYGGHEPHRAYEDGYGRRLGKSLNHADPPAFLPDTPTVRSDLLDYFAEIEWFDRHLMQMLDQLDTLGELENTLVIVTGDNGMPFPRAKANCYESGIHVPLAIAWPDRLRSGLTDDRIVGFVDLTATIVDAAGASRDGRLAENGQSLVGEFDRDPETPATDPSAWSAFASRERHSSSRYENWTYPQRAARHGDLLYVVNERPWRWPAGDPQKFDGDTLGPPHGGYHDIDASPTLSELIERRREFPLLFRAAVDLRPREELFDVRADPACLTNLLDRDLSAERTADYQAIRDLLAAARQTTGDPRIDPASDVFETYRRFSPIRTFPKPPTELPD